MNQMISQAYEPEQKETGHVCKTHHPFISAAVIGDHAP